MEDAPPMGVRLLGGGAAFGGLERAEQVGNECSPTGMQLQAYCSAKNCS